MNLIVMVLSSLLATPPAHADRTIASIAPPAGFARTPMPKGSFGAWLRALDLKPQGTPVRHYDGTIKPNQGAHYAVVDLSTGKRNLQQCADAIIRLRSEYLWQRGTADQISFRFTNNTAVPWKKWRQGWRTKVRGNKVKWVKSAPPSRSRATFDGYLRTLMMYAGTASLSRELPRREPARLGAGDVLVQGGFPGHAVMVLDEARSSNGETVLLLGQSFMPAQDFHVLVNPSAAAISPWYRAADIAGRGIATPEWKPFRARDLRRFPR